MLADVSPRGAGTAEDRQAKLLEGARVAVLSRLDLWGIAPPVMLVHFGDHLHDLRTKIFLQDNAFSPACLPVIQRSLWDLAAQHFLKAHGLRAELKPVSIADFAAAAFVLDRVGLPKPFLSVQPRAALAANKLDDIAGAADPKP